MTTPATPHQESALTFPGAPQMIDGWFVRPPGSQPLPGIVLVHDVYGLTGHVKDVARRLAGAGYAVLAPNLYTRGDGPSGGFPPKREEVSKMVRYPDPRAIADVRGVIATLRSRKDVRPDHIGVMGFSFGARYALFAAGADEGVAAAAMFYPIILYPELNDARPRQPLMSVPALRCPSIVFYGGKDALLPPSHVTFFQSLLQGLGKTHEFHIYPGVDHGFMNSTIKNYRPQESEDAWAKTFAFFKRHLQENS